MLRISFLLILLSCVIRSESQNLIAEVNTLLGTRGVWLYGRTTPFVTPPFGMTQWTACTRDAKIRVPLYNHWDHQIRGFRASHKPAMWMGDYGHVSLMPETGKSLIPGLPSARFSHRHEKAGPDYYHVLLNPGSQNAVSVEMTATSRTGLLRVIFKAGAAHRLYIEASQMGDSSGFVRIEPETGLVTGWNKDRQSAHLGPPLPGFKGYFTIQVQTKIIRSGTWTEGKLSDSVQAEGLHCGAWLDLDPEQDTVLIYTGTSFIDDRQALENLKKESLGKSFEEVRKQTAEKWENHLSRIKISGGSSRDRSIFYSCMYHCLLFPREFSEYGRYYSAFDDRIHKGESYNDYSLWDTYRAQHPLLSLIAPERVPGMVNALTQMYKEGGYMPKWPNPTYTSIMIGTHADAVIADAVTKGFSGIDTAAALAACLKNAFVPPVGDSCNRWGDRALWTNYEARAGSVWYNRIGYVPCDKTNESVSCTMEYAYGDYCVGKVAEWAGLQDTARLLFERSRNYRNLYRTETGFMAPKKLNGQWNKNPYEGFTEGSPWTYLFSAQHDVPGMIELLGGRTEFLRKLNANFDEGHYIHENEPGHHFTYLYNYAGDASSTQKRVAEYRRKKYGSGPHGLHGDDDCGQMSAWYIFSAMGFYPVCPGSAEYAIGSPLFPELRLCPDPQQPEKCVTIRAQNAGRKNIYIKKALIDSLPIQRPFLSHESLMKARRIDFAMDRYPAELW